MMRRSIDGEMPKSKDPFIQEEFEIDVDLSYEPPTVSQSQTTMNNN